MMGLASDRGDRALLLDRGWNPLTPAAVLLGASTSASDVWTLHARDLRRGRGCRRDDTVPGDRRHRRCRRHAGGAAARRFADGRRQPTRKDELWHTMSGSGDVRPRAACRLPDEADIDEFVAMLAQFESGEITPDEWRAFRLVRGTYGQRQTGTRRCCASRFRRASCSQSQLDALADVAERYSRGFGHITTRQNMQLHFVKLHDVEPAMRQLGGARADDARGVRQFGAQHHRVPVRGRRRGRAVRRHAVRRGADALSPAPSAELDAAAQVQDRVRRVPGRSHRDRPSTTSAGRRASRRSTAARFAASG